jgi:hypothetical protein
MRAHRKWIAYVEYFDDLDESDRAYYERVLNNNQHVLIMIMKLENEEKDRRKKVFEQLCDWFPTETKIGKMIISQVPDIKKIGFNGDKGEENDKH